LKGRELCASEILRFVCSGRRPDHFAGVVVEHLGGPIEISKLVVPVCQENDHGARNGMLMHGHGFVRSQVFLKNSDPLVLEFQVGVLWIGNQGIGRLIRCTGLLREGGNCRSGDPKEFPGEQQKTFVMSTRHEKILDHGHE
jgi:hypothetical protein